MRKQQTKLWRQPSSPATVYNNCDQVVHPVGIGGITGRVEEAQFQWEHNTVRQLGVTVQLFHILEALEVESEDHWQLLYTHPT